MKVDVFTPDDHVGDVIDDLNRRRGVIKDREAGTTGVRVKQTCCRDVWLHGSLRTMTSGRGQFSMGSHTTCLASGVATTVIEEAKHVKAKLSKLALC